MAQINLRVDDEIKQTAESICAEIGISMSTAINIYLRKLCRERRIPFELSADPFFSSENQAALQESIRQFQEGKIVSKSLDELEAMNDA